MYSRKGKEERGTQDDKMSIGSDRRLAICRKKRKKKKEGPYSRKERRKKGDRFPRHPIPFNGYCDIEERGEGSLSPKLPGGKVQTEVHRCALLTWRKERGEITSPSVE